SDFQNTTEWSRALLAQRERPSGRDHLSFPSGHGSSAFATATSLAYSYGYKVGIPAYALAGFVAASRVNENIHWLSDVVAGAALGIFWGRASALNTGSSIQNWTPFISGDVVGFAYHTSF
ncbi:MAG: phosphatase PAP2 family protein, partial [Bdellovibrio sp.]